MGWGVGTPGSVEVVSRLKRAALLRPGLSNTEYIAADPFNRYARANVAIQLSHAVITGNRLVGTKQAWLDLGEHGEQVIIRENVAQAPLRVSSFESTWK